MLAGTLWIWKSSHSRAPDRLKPAGGINSKTIVVMMMVLVKRKKVLVKLSRSLRHFPSVFIYSFNKTF